jgi:hypothetical protein
MSQKAELLAAHDEAWTFKWESILSALKEVSNEEAVYQHPAYADEPREEGHPPSGTILWYLVHLAHCYLNYEARVKERPTNPAEIPPLEALDLGQAIDNLRLARGKFRSAIEELNEEQIDEKIFNGKSVAELARMIVRHDAWHSGQIAMVRRLHKHSLKALVQSSDT